MKTTAKEWLSDTLDEAQEAQNQQGFWQQSSPTTDLQGRFWAVGVPAVGMCMAMGKKVGIQESRCDSGVMD